MHQEKAALDLGERREAEVKGLEEKQTGGRERRNQGQRLGVKAWSHLSATRVGWERTELGDQSCSASPAAICYSPAPGRERGGRIGSKR